jgi:hypothetical protein
VLKRCAVAILLVVVVLLSGCATSSVKTHTSQAFSIAQNQRMVPILPFTNTLVPEAFSEMVFNDFVDSMNDNQASSGFSWFGIVKDDISQLEKILPPAHIFINGEIWSYIENAGCCSTELRVKSRLRIYRVLSRELLWDAEISLDGFFEHDSSTLAVERDKLGKRLSALLTRETLKALHDAKRMATE